MHHHLLARPLVSATLWMLGPHWNSPRLSCSCPATWRCCSFVSARRASSHALAYRRWGGCWGGAIHNPGSGPGLVSLPILPHPHYQGELSCTDLTGSPLAAESKGRDWFFCFNILKVGSSTPAPSDCAAQARRRDRFPECYSW